MKKAPRDRDGHLLAGPGRGGPSVSVNDWSHMPAPVRPKEFGGHNPLNVMYVSLSTALAPAKLTLGTVNAETKHADVEAADECTLDVFQSRLASTRGSWTPAHAPTNGTTP